MSTRTRKVTIPCDADRDGVDEGITVELTPTGIEALRFIARAGDKGYHPGPAHGQAVQRLNRHGLTNRIGRWADRHVLSAMGRKVLDELDTPR